MNYDENIDRFISIARDYCAWLEGSPLAPAQEHFAATQFIADLYGSALKLPGVNSDFLDCSFEDQTVSVEAKRAIVERLKSFPFRYYFEVFHAITDTPEEPVCGDITDDLVDIYADLKEGLMLLDAVDRPRAVFHWRTTFGFHWGRHATSALRALHMYEPDDDSEAGL
jgi:hypothetical protein